MTDKPVGTSYKNQTLMERAMVHTSSNTKQNTSQSDTNTINASKVQPVFTICIGQHRGGSCRLVGSPKKNQNANWFPISRLFWILCPIQNWLSVSHRNTAWKKAISKKPYPKVTTSIWQIVAGLTSTLKHKAMKNTKVCFWTSVSLICYQMIVLVRPGLAMKGYFRSYQNGYSICDFFRRHYSVLTQIDADNLDLDDGVLVRIFGTSLGGTSTGSTQIITAMLKDSLEQLTSKVDVNSFYDFGNSKPECR